MTDTVRPARDDPEMANVRVELFSHPGCPLVDDIRTVVRQCLLDLGLETAVIERTGAYPSPVVVVDGLDVLGGPAPADDVACCRVTVPDRGQLLAALSRERPRP